MPRGRKPKAKASSSKENDESKDARPEENPKVSSNAIVRADTSDPNASDETKVTGTVVRQTVERGLACGAAGWVHSAAFCDLGLSPDDEFHVRDVWQNEDPEETTLEENKSNEECANEVTEAEDSTSEGKATGDPEVEDSSEEGSSTASVANDTPEVPGDVDHSPTTETQDVQPPDVTSNAPAAKRDDSNGEERQGVANSTEPSPKSDGNEAVEAPETTNDAINEATSDNEGNDPNGSDDDEAEEMWDLKKVLSIADVTKEAPIKCSTEKCMLVACCIWVSNLSPDDKWYSCIDCQSNDFGGWPEIDEMPIRHMSKDHKRVLASKCSSRKSPGMPNLPDSEGVDATSPEKDGDGPVANTVTPPPNSLGSYQGRGQTLGGKAKVTPASREVATPAPTKPSASALALHRKWQEAAEALGGPTARIVVKKPEAKKLIFDCLYDSFRPMNITQIYKELKAVVPSPVLKSCLDEMALDKADDQLFAESDDEESKELAKKPEKASGDSFARSLVFKGGRSSNSSLYYVDHTKLQNGGNGLDMEQRNALFENAAKAEAEKTTLKEALKSAIAETDMLLGQPTNEEAVCRLEKDESSVLELREKLEAARELKVNEKHKLKTKKRIENMTSVWRKRRRLTRDFLMSMEESTEGTISMKKCLAGDGPIELESDEVAIAGAISYAKNKRSRAHTSTHARQKSKLNGVSGLKSTSAASSGGPAADADFIAVRLDSQGCVTRVYVDNE